MLLCFLVALYLVLLSVYLAKQVRCYGWQRVKSTHTLSDFLLPFLFYFFFSSVVLLVAIQLFIVEPGRNNQNAAIFSLKENSQLSGSFFLGSGQINSTAYYFAFYKNSRGGFERWQVHQDNAAIFEDVEENQQPYVSWQQIHRKVSNWVIPWDYELRLEDTSYDIHVPKNTVIQKFQVN